MPRSPSAAEDQWGYLIKPDKTATPLLEELLLGIAHYIVSNNHAMPRDQGLMIVSKIRADMSHRGTLAVSPLPN